MEFTSPLAAEKARGIYNDWQGWGPKGLQIDLALGGAEQPGAGVKRGREGELLFLRVVSRSFGVL